MTLVASQGRWTGVAALDAPLVPAAWTVAALRAAPRVPHAIAFTGTPRPGTIFLDRDGTLIEDRHYLGDPAGIAFLPGAVAGLRSLADLGLRLVVVTNQSGIGSGRLTRSQVDAVHQRLTELLAREGVPLAGIYLCPHRSDEGCECRKPGDGMVRRAAAELGLFPSAGLVVGDKAADLGLARRLGVPAVLVTTGEGQATLRSGDVSADYLVDGLDELARLVGHPAGLAEAADLPTD